MLTRFAMKSITFSHKVLFMKNMLKKVGILRKAKEQRKEVPYYKTPHTLQLTWVPFRLLYLGLL